MEFAKEVIEEKAVPELIETPLTGAARDVVLPVEPVPSGGGAPVIGKEPEMAPAAHFAVSPLPEAPARPSEEPIAEAVIPAPPVEFAKEVIEEKAVPELIETPLTGAVRDVVLPEEPAPSVGVAPVISAVPERSPAAHFAVSPLPEAPARYSEEPIAEADDSSEFTVDHAVEEVIADFRQWLYDLRDEPPLADQEEPETIDLQTVLGHFVALRQEVTLQTRSVRSQQEQSAETLRQLQQSLELLSRSQARNEQLGNQMQTEHLRPLVKSLTDLYDAMALASREIQRAQDALSPLLVSMADLEAIEDGPLPQASAYWLPPGEGFLSRWLLNPAAEAALRASQEETQSAIERMRSERIARQERLRQANEASVRVREALASIVTGYTMSLQRIERALKQHGLEPIPTVGETFDPDLMEAIAKAAGTGQAAGEVVAEIRRGYMWHGRVFRCAQVSVAVN